MIESSITPTCYWETGSVIVQQARIESLGGNTNLIKHNDIGVRYVEFKVTHEIQIVEHSR